MIFVNQKTGEKMTQPVELILNKALFVCKDIKEEDIEKIIYIPNKLINIVTRKVK